MKTTLFGRTLAMAICGAAMLSAATAVAQDKYPDRPIQVIVPFAAGSASDVVGRIVLDRMAEDLGARFVVDNQAGASGNIGTAAVARAAPDGYTLVVTASGPLAVNQALFSNIGYDPLTAFEPISLLATLPNIIVVNNQQPIKSVDDLIAAAKKNPGGLNYGSIGNGSSQHLAAAYFEQVTGTRMSHVPYRVTGQLVDGSGRRSVAGQLSAHSECHRSAQGRCAAGAGRDVGQALGDPAGSADHQGTRHRRLRSLWLVRDAGAEGHAGADDRQAARLLHESDGRSGGPPPHHRGRRRTGDIDAGRTARLHAGRSQEVGRHHSRQQYQSELVRCGALRGDFAEHHTEL